MERWITAHRIGIAAYLGSGLGGIIEDQNKLLKLRPKLGGLLKRYLIDALDGDRRARQRLLLGLPPSVLHLLSQSLKEYPNLARRELSRLSREVYKASIQLASPWDESEHTPLSYAQSWSHHLLFGSGSPPRLLELGRSLTGINEWMYIADTDGETSFTIQAETLRDPQSSTRERCDAISRMRRVLGRMPYWAQIENTLYQQQFFWPLLVLRQEQGHGVAASMPVAVDVIFDGQDKLRFAKEDAVLSNEWRRSLRRCMEIAKEIWQAEHWYRADPTGNLIQGASVLIDFAIADQIAADATSLINRGIKVIDRSAEAYFVQAIMSRLLGASATVASAITGSVEHRPSDHKADYRFRKPGGVRAKLAFAFASRSFERIVLPYDALSTFNAFKRGTLHRQTADTLFPATLGRVTDIVQVLGWRRHRYVRCPEVQWYAQGRGASMLLQPRHPEIERVCEAMAGNEGSLLRLPGVSPLAVLSALKHIDNQLKGKYTRNRLPISWAFVRAVPWELDARFWHMLWEAFGASRDTFQSLLKQPGRDQAALQIAWLLNHFRPAPESPSHMAPDVLVIVDAQYLAQAEEQVTNPLSRQFLVMQMFEELERRNLLERYSPLHRKHLGRTRIILLSQEEAEAEAAEPAVASDEQDDLGKRFRSLVKDVKAKPRVYQLLTGVSHLEERLVKILHALAVYRYGFTQQAASLVIHRLWEEEPKPTGLEIRHEILNSLLGQSLLRWSHGMYHVPDEVREKLNIDELSPLERVKLHFTAGSAIAPYVAMAEYPSLAADTAFRPQFVHEARNHFDTALSVIKELKADGGADLPEELPLWEKTVQRAMGSMIKFAEPPTWGQMEKLLFTVRDAESAFAMAQELLAWDEDHNIPIHPEHYLWNARAAAQLAKRRFKLRAQASEYFELALEACKSFPSEATSNTAHVLSNYAAFLFSQVPAREAAAIEYSQQVVQLLKEGVPHFVIDGKWFDQYGDRLDHAEAAALYEMGRQAHPKMGQLWLKALGAASLGSVSDVVDIVLSALAANTRRLRIYTLEARPAAVERLEEAERVLASISETAADTFLATGQYYIRLSADLLKDNSEEAEAKALRVLHRGVKNCPDDGNVYFALGRLHEERMRWEEAEEAYRASIERIPGFGAIHLALGQLYERREKWEEAEEAYRTGVKQAASDGTTHLALGQFYEHRERWKEAEAAYRTGVEQAASDGSTHLMLGQFYERRERWKEAEAAYRTGVEQAASAGDVHLMLGQFYERNERWEEAEAAYRAGVEQGIDYAQIYLALGQLYERNEKWEEAEEAYRAGVERVPGFGATHLALGQLYERREKWEEAEATYRAGIERVPSFGTTHLALGQLYERRERRKEAEAAYLAGVEQAASAGDVHLVLGQFYERNERWKEAEAAYRTGVEQAASDGSTHLMLGQFYERHERWDEAEAAYRAGVERVPGFGSTHLMLGQFYERRERWEKAEAVYRRKE